MAFIFGHAVTGFTAVAAGNPNPGAVKAGFVLSSTEPAFVAGGGRFGDGSFEMSGSGQRVKLPFPVVASGRTIVSFAMNFQGPLNPDAEGAGFLSMYNDGGSVICLRLVFTTLGQLRVMDQAGAIAGTSAPGIVHLTNDTLHHHIAVDADIGNASGVVNVYVDGVQVLALTMIDLDGGAGTSCDMVLWSNEDGPGFTERFDVLRLSQILIHDTSGADAFTAYLGDKRLYPILPTADDGAQEWDPLGAGASYVEVDDALTDDSDEDASYVEATSAALVDQYELANLPVGATGIVSVILIMEARKSDAGAEHGVLGARATHAMASTDVSFGKTLGTGYLEYQTTLDDVPGGAGWTKSQVDALKIGPRIP